MGALNYEQFLKLAPDFVRGSRKPDGQPNQKLLSQLPMGYSNSFFLWPNLERHVEVFPQLVGTAAKLKKLGNEQLNRVPFPDRETLIKIFPWSVGLSLETHARFAMGMMALYEDPRTPELSEDVYKMAKAICGNGYPKEAVEPCLRLADMPKIKTHWAVLKDKGVRGIETLDDFSSRLLEHVDLSQYSDLDCRAALLDTLERSEIEDGHQARLSETTVLEFEIGFNRLSAEGRVRPPSIDTLFTMQVKAGKGNGKRTSALSPGSGNLVRRVAKGGNLAS